MRDVALVSFAYSAVDKDPVHNEVEMIVPVVREAVAQSGLPRPRSASPFPAASTICRADRSRS